MAKAELTATLNGSSLLQGLTQWQQKLGLVRESTGRLVDSQGRWVDGLTRSQLQLGLYRNSLGQTVNMLGQSVDGLRDWEVQNGRYVDSLGNVYNAQNERIRIGEAQIRQEQQLAREQQQLAREQAEAQIRRDTEVQNSQRQLANGIKSLGQPVLQLATTFAVLGGAEQKTVAQIAALSGTFIATVGATKKITDALRLYTTATNQQITRTVILNAVTGNWVALATGTIAAGGTLLAMSQMGETADKTKNSIEKLTEAIEHNQSVLKKSVDKSLGEQDFGTATKVLESYKITDEDVESAKQFYEEHKRGWRGFAYDMTSWVNPSAYFASYFFDIESFNETEKRAKTTLDALKKDTEEYKKLQVELFKASDKFATTIEQSALTEFEKAYQKIDKQIQDAKALAKYYESIGNQFQKERFDEVVSILEKQLNELIPKEVTEAGKFLESFEDESTKRVNELNKKIKEYENALTNNVHLSKENQDVLRKAIDKAKKEADDPLRKENKESAQKGYDKAIEYISDEREKAEKKLNDQLKEYTDALAKSKDLTKEQQDVLQKAIDKTKKDLADTTPEGWERKENKKKSKDTLKEAESFNVSLLSEYDKRQKELNEKIKTWSDLLEKNSKNEFLSAEERDEYEKALQNATKELAKPEKKKEDEIVKSAQDYLNSKLTERGKKEVELNDQLKKYEDKMNELSDLKQEEIDTLKEAIEQTKKDIKNNTVRGDIEDELKKLREKEKEQQDRLQEMRNMGAGTGKDKELDELYRKEQKDVLGEVDKYFDKTTDALQEFEKTARDIIEKGKAAGMTQEKIDNALRNAEEEAIKKLQKEKKALTQTGGSGNATMGSIEAYKIINASQMPEVQAIKDASDDIQTAIRESGEATRKTLRNENTGVFNP